MIDSKPKGAIETPLAKDWQERRQVFTKLLVAILAPALPWLAYYALRFIHWLDFDIYPSVEGAKLATTFLTSIVATCLVLCAVRRSMDRFWQDLMLICIVATVCVFTAPFITEPRPKSDPPSCGEKLIDHVLLATPAVVFGVMLIGVRSLRGPARTMPSRTSAPSTQLDR